MTRKPVTLTLPNGVTLNAPRLTTGPAGQVSALVTVTYPGEEPTRVEFVGSVYGGPVVTLHPRMGQMFVTDPERFGRFHANPPAWVRRYFS